VDQYVGSPLVGTLRPPSDLAYTPSTIIAPKSLIPVVLQRRLSFTYSTADSILETGE
jgi:hypothetical protein